MQAGSDLQNVARSRLPAHAAEHCSTAGGLTCMQTVQTVQLLQTVERVRWRDLIPLSGFQKLNILVVNIFMDHMMPGHGCRVWSQSVQSEDLPRLYQSQDCATRGRGRAGDCQRRGERD